MRTNTIILTMTLGLLTLTAFVTYTTLRNKYLREQLSQQHLLPPQVSYQDSGITLTGKGLVLYNVSHSAYPTLSVHQLQITNTFNNLTLNLNGLHGELISFFQKSEPYAFKRQILSYSPEEELLQHPLLSLVALGYNHLDFDILLSAKRPTPNQIKVDLSIKDIDGTKAQFTANILQQNSNLSIWENLNGQVLPFQITYLHPTIKQRFDEYTNSKGLAQITEGQQVLLPFLKK